METSSESILQLSDRIKSTTTVGAGLCSWVHRLDAVAKCYNSNQTSEKQAEISVYERLESAHSWHDGIMRYYGILDGQCLILQFAKHGSIRQYLRRTPQSLETKLRWAQQATEAVSHLHSMGILHCDISCNNIFINAELNALLGDFSGSSLDGKPPLTWYETSHCHPDMQEPTVKAEAFALGSTFYEILTGERPFDGMDECLIEDAYRSGRFPNLELLPALRRPIAKCWNQQYENIQELLHDIIEEGRAICLSSPKLPARRGPALSVAVFSLAAILPFLLWLKPTKSLLKG
ncbi:spindle assembly checkpoint kinase [Fusarium coicis]|nr:spindle assembly checkpoint kinase [Fusarium coicis]